MQFAGKPGCIAPGTPKKNKAGSIQPSKKFELAVQLYNRSLEVLIKMFPGDHPLSDTTWNGRAKKGNNDRKDISHLGTDIDIFLTIESKKPGFSEEKEKGSWVNILLQIASMVKFRASRLLQICQCSCFRGFFFKSKARCFPVFVLFKLWIVHRTRRQRRQANKAMQLRTRKISYCK